MKKILSAIIGSALLFALAGCAKKAPKGEFTVEQGKFKVGVEIGYPPFEYFDVDGKTPVGFDIELAKAIAAKLGLEAEFIDTAWDGILAGLDTDKYDVIISAMSMLPERMANYDFSDPYIGNCQSIILKKNSTQDIKEPKDLAGKKVAFQSETSSDFWMRKVSADENFTYEANGYDKVLNAYDDLKFGRVDAVASDYLVAIDYLNNQADEYKCVWQGLSDDFFGVCMKKGNTALQEKVNQALTEMKEDGSLAKLYVDVFKQDLSYSLKTE